MPVGVRRIFGGEQLFRLAKQELGSMSAYLSKRPPDEAAALAVLGSSLEKMCDGLAEVAKFMRETYENP